MAAIQIPDELAEQIDQAAQRAGEARDVFLREAVQSRLDDQDDVAIAAERLKNPGKRLTLEQVKRDLCLDD
ncbi:MAG TPA: ribbon-helix-helix protein, CopG family [Edaphobacter sp.]|jgi:predicted DNA-binding protein|nr:ribbon-helix-helix protein, CopG family [Edaphobacter sp.]